MENTHIFIGKLFEFSESEITCCCLSSVYVLLLSIDAVVPMYIHKGTADRMLNQKTTCSMNTFDLFTCENIFRHFY